MIKSWIFALLAGLAGAAGPTVAATYYVAPLGAVLVGTADGTLEHPFASVDAALASNKIVGGDEVLLMDGTFAMLRISRSFTSPVVFRSQNQRKARVDSIYLSGSARNIVVQNLKVWSTNPVIHQATLVAAASGVSDVKFIGLDVRAGEDAYNYLNWTANEWLARAANGFIIDGTRIEIKQSVVTGAYFGIVLSGPDNKVISNRVDGFAGDGMRGNGHRGEFRDNIVKNCVSVDGNHADGFQSFSGSSVIGLVLERNMFIEWTHAPSHPLRCGMQGIAMFDGFQDNVTIINNVVAGRNGHGITVNGARGAQIINNTVVNIDGVQPGWPWIGIYPSNSGVPPSDVLVVNNLAMGYTGVGNDKVNRVKFTNNRIVRSIPHAFPDWTNENYAPRPDGRFIDAALPEYAPRLDILRHARPEGAGPDLGAYEVSQLGAAPALSDEVLEPPPVISAEADAAEAASGDTSGTTSTGGAKFVPAP